MRSRQTALQNSFHTRLLAHSAMLHPSERHTITLTELLDSRDARQAAQRRLLEQNPDKTLVVATVVIPGNVKRSQDSAVIAEAACEALERVFGNNAECMEKKDLATGFEAYYLTCLTPESTKEYTSHIEDTHPLGRMMDIDVFDKNGNPVSRTGQGKLTRRCLLCDNDARICMRAFTHTQEELLAEIHRRVSLWLDARAESARIQEARHADPTRNLADEP